ncbi:hypothetical protein [Lacticaseibacillus sharpeae]|uniref:Uncharacterized protein n=1 Tax=Lacticaseibacillus sharpeae JCM 1186 = DSM 20505 TaxID=1291052 RepID=A0A0R1ZLM6_9LACO|nr:hypothetical protein [Lacticaseibacillus sharpeae]KRM55365.1 hypothetical protein FC18_GL001398 [Lacticaseibacillus sharpeae JCM 1186 = DSM 20505]
MGPNLSFEFRTLRRAPAMLGFIIAMALLFLAPNLPRLHPVVGYEQEVQSYMGDASQISAQLEAWRKNPPATAPTNPSVRELRAVQTKLTAVIAAETATPVQVRTVMRAKLAYGQLLVRGARAGWAQFTGSAAFELARVKTLRYQLRHHIAEIPAGSTQLPGLHQLSQNLTTFLNGIWLAALLALWCATFLIADKRQRVNALVTIMPVRKTVVLGNKLLSFLLLAGSGLLASVGIAFVVPTLMNGAGNWQYPVAYSLDGQHVFLRHLGVLVLEQYSLLMLVLLFLAVCAVFIQLWTKNVLVSLLGMLLIALSGQVPTSSWLPTSYFNASAVLTSLNGGATFGHMAGVLLAASLLLGLISFAVVRVRQRL